VRNTIKNEIARVISESDDTRLRGVTITDVKLSRDLRNCTVYYSVIGDEKDKVRAKHALESAADYIRVQLYRRVHAKRLPKLVFRYDDRIEKAVEVDWILEDLSAEREDREEQ